MSKFVVKTSCSFDVELPNELLDFDKNQLQAKKDIELILRDSGTAIYGTIGLQNPRK